MCGLGRVWCVLLLTFSVSSFAQTGVAAPVAPVGQSTGAVPRLMKFSGTLLNVQDTTGVTFALYSDQSGGAPLWLETQNVTPDANGRYTIYLGANHADGVPLDVFATGQARWLGVQAEGQAEQPRVMLVSVPYALTSGDAQTLGGKPLSAFVLAGTTTGMGNDGLNYVNTAAVQSASAALVTPLVTGGTAGYLGMFTTPTDLGNSRMYQDGTGRVGLNTTTPIDALHIRFSDITGSYTGLAVQNLGSGSASYSGMLFYDQDGKLGQFQGFNNLTHEYRINNIAPNGTINFMLGSSSKFLVTNNGNIGIGTSTPGAKLEVNGDVKITAGSGGGVLYSDGTRQASAANVLSGSGLITTSANGFVNLGVDTNVLQKRVSQNCPTGAISQINQDGSVDCVNLGLPASSAGGQQFLSVFAQSGLEESYNTGLVLARLITDLPLTVTKVSLTANSIGYGTCTPAVFRITNGAVYEDIPVVGGINRYDTPDHSLVFPGGSEIRIILAQSAYCGVRQCDYYGNYCYYALGRAPSDVAAAVRYRLASEGETTSCPANLALVNGSCVDVQSDAQNCGTAGHVCPSGTANALATCNKGQCGLGSCIVGAASASDGQCTCYSGGTVCNSPAEAFPYCTNLSSDPANCGTCGNACPTGQVCQGGKCQSCPSGQSICSNQCVNTQTDPNNCGSCGNQCSTIPLGITNGCSSGKCSYTCSSGYQLCTNGNSSACVNLLSDNSNCGACGNVCAAGQACQGGTCQLCAAGQILCNGKCVNPQTDANNCGTCGNVCYSVANGTSTGCSSGHCGATCYSGYTACTTTSSPYVSCVNTTSDPQNCGACGNVCASGQLCQAGTCQSCAAGQIVCNGKCVNPQTDTNNCGGCGIACNSWVSNGTAIGCSSGHCGATCNAGYTACTSSSYPYVSCVNTTNDSQNCGACGNVCGAGQICQAGMCQSCAAGQILCNGKCVNLQTDSNNCGGCGNACSSYVSNGAPTGCSNAQCGVTCNVGYTVCTSTSSPNRLTCVNTVSDPQNCGACGNVCGAGQICQAGKCQSCAAGQILCNGKCVNPQTDSNNCGACGSVCSSVWNGTSTGCSNGQCGATCDAGYTVCRSTSYPNNVTCVNTEGDPQNCGACGNVCGVGQVCQAGQCQSCAAGQMLCNGKCINPLTDSGNCGGCGNGCSYVYNGTSTGCSKGKCGLVCNSGYMACTVASSSSVTCLDVTSDPQNCGACGNVCASGQVCRAGTCQSCPSGQTICYGQCVNTQTDYYNCGGCSRSCYTSISNGTATGCSNGQCGATCNTGYTYCNSPYGYSSCVNMSTDWSNCGACGKSCPSGQVCSGGQCQCSSGYTACTAPGSSYVVCSNVQTDVNNCGACGNVCAAGQTCQAGQCQYCASGQQLCNGNCVNVQSDNNNCGACGRYCYGPFVCQGGNCQPCPAGQTGCWNGSTYVCVSTQTDPNNCGSCGNKCTVSQTCSAGTCQ